MAYSPPASKREFKTEFENMIAWMRALDVAIEPGRIQHYMAALDRWFDPTTLDAAKAAFPQAIGAAYEISYFLEIFAAFKGTPIGELSNIAAKLRNAVVGPLDFADERNTNSAARNFLFEALVAAKFHRPNQGLITLNVPNSDAGFSFEDWTVLIECKRLGSESQLEKRTRDARNQLCSNLKDLPANKSLGIIAIDISRVVSELEWSFPEVGAAKCEARTKDLIDSFFENNRTVLSRILEVESRQIVALLFRVSQLARSPDGQRMAVSNDWGAVAMRGISPKSVHLLQRIFTAMSS